jgi:endonuclease YncB( thermonuclease family)
MTMTAYHDHRSIVAKSFPHLCVMLLLLLFSPHHTSAADFTGPVVGVLDGDTIEVLHNNRAVRIRLNAIDCPEKGQAYAKKAKQTVSALAFGKEVTLRTHGLDKYGRTIADVLLMNGTNVDHELVKYGWCWWYRKYAPGNTVLEKLEKDAREAKKGLWVDPAPVPPWVYRKTRRGQSLDLSEMVPLESVNDVTSSRGPPGLHATPSEAALSESATASSSYPIIGNRRSHIYHRVHCPNYSQIASHNRVSFNSAAEAEAAGYRKAGNCS